MDKLFSISGGLIDGQIPEIFQLSEGVPLKGGKNGLIITEAGEDYPQSPEAGNVGHLVGPIDLFIGDQLVRFILIIPISKHQPSLVALLWICESFSSAMLSRNG